MANSNVLHLLYVLFLVIHVPTTVLLDAQSVFPRSSFPSWAVELLDWHIKTNADHLVSTNPPWFLALVYCEIMLQLPFFLVGAYAIYTKRSWIRIPAIIYGAHVSTTMVPILGDIFFGPQHGPHSLALAGIYMPYLLVPFAMMMSFALDSDPFKTGAGKKKSHQKSA
ncbi:MAG: hypothetical protein WDW38_007632 [Sanguina aurantia]